MGLLGRTLGRLFRGRPAQRHIISTLDFTGGSTLQRVDGYYTIRQSEYDIRIARQLTQSDGYGRELVEIFVDSVVGKGGIRVVWDNPRIQAMWDAWRWNPAQPREKIDEAQRDTVRGLIRDGETLTQIMGTPDNIYLKNLDPLDLPLETGGAYRRRRPQGRTVQGIEFDDMGRPVRYRFRPVYGFGDAAQTLDAREVIHVYAEFFPGQIRGISWMRPTIDPLRHLAMFERNFSSMVDTAAKLPGYFTAPEELQMPLDGLEVEGQDEDDILALQRRWLEQNMNADPSTRPRLPQGTEWHGVDVSRAVNGQLYTDTRKGLIARIARGMGLSYNSLAGDLGEANYSSLRVGMIENQAQFRRVQALLLGWLERVADEWLAWQAMRDPYVDRMRDRVGYRLDAPTFELIDPLKEAATGRQLVDNRVRSRQQLIREAGGDADATLAEIVEEERRLLELRRSAGLADDGKSFREEEADADESEESETPVRPPMLIQEAVSTNGVKAAS